MNLLRKRNLPQSPHLPVSQAMSTTEHKLRKEIAIMKKCRHPHVVRLLEVIDDQIRDSIYLVMEYLEGGEIKWRNLAEEPILRVDQTRRICRDVILGLEYLHHQGIIHRDIKPANLLWTADRRMVKIADFGVSHFSYAQRLSAAGEDDTDSVTDPHLMDDSDLSKFAGTPMFLAPEIISDTSTAESSTSSNLNQLGTSSTSTVGRKKAPITKAIDIWAFGVTLYGLLFGTLPFRAENEYHIYNVIRTGDWDVPDIMGLDRLPVGGRRQKKPSKGQQTEGYLVVKLLEGILEKDVKKRLTLDQVKASFGP
ncbi:kinase-like protein [Abortiporus biennis]|nr:kinase-like protein [Abortiporus biennis]